MTGETGMEEKMLTEQIRRAGVVGCGGAGFPTHKKICGKAEDFIVNGAECEPLLRTDRYIMANCADQLIAAVEAIGDCLEATRLTIALKAEYVPQVQALEEAIARKNSRVRLHLLAGFYPAGDEHVLVHEVTGRTVPPGGLPMAVGAVVDNVATVLAVYDAMEGKPLTHKYLTVTGAVEHPVVMRVPVGTAFTECIRQAGGDPQRPAFVVAGGPMMGKSVGEQGLEKAVVTKTTSGILVLPADGPHAVREELSVEKILNRARSSCIQCSYCTQLCPRFLLGHPLQPHRIMRRMAMASLEKLPDDKDVLAAQLCCECGVCELYACPMGLSPRRINVLVKGELARRGIRGAFNLAEEVHPDRELRKVPVHRAAARAGVGAFMSLEPEGLVTYTPKQAEIPLKMHIGAPAQPVVAPGDRVEEGTLIARCPENALGAHIHASLSGIVTAVGERIVIESR